MILCRNWDPTWCLLPDVREIVKISALSQNLAVADISKPSCVFTSPRVMERRNAGANHSMKYGPLFFVFFVRKLGPLSCPGPERPTWGSP